ncbi:MAG: response regulator [Gemmatimonadales bacterium]
MSGTVLLVEDHPLNRELARELLEVKGFTVLEAATGQDALRLAAESRPDLVLLDLRLPDLDGMEVARRLQGDASTRHLTLVALTAQAMRGDEQAARAAGFAGYITKPIDTRTFPAEIGRFLSLAEGSR